MASESPITQAHDPSIDNDSDYDDELIYQQNDDDDVFEQDVIPQTLRLNLRGTQLDLDRDTLVGLPESLLIAMFPNGLILGGRQDDNGHSSDHVGDGDKKSSTLDDSNDVQVTHVDFDPICLEYVLQYYRQAKQLSNDMQRERLAAKLHDSTLTMPNSPAYHPLLDKQPIIVLREEMEYFCVPCQKNSSVADITKLKLQCGKYLKQQDEIFAALQKSIARENNMAEQHLIDMLCDAGFSHNDRWGHRSLEPTRTCIISMGLVLLKTTGPDNHMATAQKLMLFWRKPARKCWWDGNTVDIQGQSVKLWARRTWCLELALV
ncbi:hypothetical protein BC941DRAFT_468720 [Chlamydoabsidia padenii]|nr:hypothetical protein BC941DRAFT_468720 [Chlamydoabsidia padenii]